jgi:hypothetical protein
MTVFGILAAVGTRKVRLIVSDETEDLSLAAPLVRVRSGSAGVGDLRIGALAIPGAHCVERLAARDASGKLLWRGPPDNHGCG